ncbi:kin of IRRE-like protein 1, partial [Hemiscyllium ocellatum]|uniref:kin of IRRE-like protein 1 n=1 Tax=Hemiscyllium ocellatum TaxID=170820 RepID=UPI0029671374
SQVLSNSNHLYLKAVTQADAGQYVCKAIVPQIGVGEREVTLHVNGPPIISSAVLQYAAEGAPGRVECYIDSTPQPDRIAWTWRENVLEVGTFERYTVERTGGPEGVRSTLLISNVALPDFETPYNCTAWNGFGSGTALIQLLKEEVLPIGLIIGVTVSLGILLTLALAGLVVFLYRRRKRSRKDVTLGRPGVKADPSKEAPYLRKELEEDDSNMSTATRVLKAMYSAYQEDMDMKPELRSDTLDTREDCELKDPTNGYYNVRGQEERLPSRTLLYSEYGGGGGRYEGRPPSRLSHASGYGPVGGGAVTVSAAAPVGSGSGGGGGGGGGGGLLASCYSRLAEYGGGEGGAEAGSQLSFDAYAYPPCGLAPYGRPTNLERLFDPAATIAPKFPSASRFSYSSSQHSEHGRPYQQRMQTHV